MPPAAEVLDMNGSVEVSFVMPCLDEAETLAGCIEAAKRCIERNRLSAEIVVADNGSTDDSREIARRMGARVVDATVRGYGAAIMAGFEAARGRYLVVGDADQSYDFEEAFPMIERLRDGADVCMGSRFEGRIEPGAMPWLHRWVGNPALSLIGRVLFRSKISDFHCGLRALTKDTFDRLRLRTTGMEFASELVVKATTLGCRIDEVPITLRPDGRSRRPHLRSFPDGWRHLRFLTTLSPRFTLFLPGLLLMTIAGALLLRLYAGPLTLGRATLDIHAMQLAALAVVVGYQAVTIAIAARIFAVSEEIGPPAPWMQRAFVVFTLERGIVTGVLLALLGLRLILGEAWSWFDDGFGPLAPERTMRPLLLGSVLTALGTQTLMSSFLYSMFGIRRRHD